MSFLQSYPPPPQLAPSPLWVLRGSLWPPKLYFSLWSLGLNYDLLNTTNKRSSKSLVLRTQLAWLRGAVIHRITWQTRQQRRHKSVLFLGVKLCFLTLLVLASFAFHSFWIIQSTFFQCARKFFSMCRYILWFYIILFYRNTCCVKSRKLSQCCKLRHARR